MANIRWHFVLLIGLVVWVLDEPPAVGVKLIVFVGSAIVVYWCIVGVDHLLCRMWPDSERTRSR